MSDMKKEITKQVTKIIASQLSVDESKVVAEANFADDLDADSLDIVELIMAFEDEFNIEMPDEVAEGMQTVGDVFSYIEENVDKPTSV